MSPRVFSEFVNRVLLDTWSERDWVDFQWFGVCDCGRLRREHAVFDDAVVLTDLNARCDAGHEVDFEDLS
jgi:hypothetical protein